MVQVALAGRAAELAALRPVLLSPECRLLTLTGPPGVGKTRLAATLAEEVGDRFPAGVIGLDVLGCATAQAAGSLLDGRLGIERGVTGTPVERLCAHLRERAALLVLDSCEAVPDLGPLLRAVMSGARRVKILATSQGRLRVASEREYAVPPLAMPESADSWSEDIDRVAAVPAMMMLLASIEAVRPGFALDSTNLRPLVDICRDLEGPSSRPRPLPLPRFSGRAAVRADGAGAPRCARVGGELVRDGSVRRPVRPP
ncbi:MAG: hypothetical protein ACR2JU_01220 [Nocardioidaceae bacterium]